LVNPVYGLLNRSGYGHFIETNVLAQTGLNFDLGFITPGLTAGGTFAYQTYSRDSWTAYQDYRVFERVSFPGMDDFYETNPTRTNTYLSYTTGKMFFYYLNVMGKIDYRRTFGDHSIDAQAHTYYQYRESEAGSGAAILPYKLQNSGLSAMYGYKERYFVKGDIGYSGSEQFSEDHRYVTTPAISGAWVVSNEDFFQNNIVNLLKLRASYGVTANDQFGASRFLYLDEIYASGTEYQRGNPNLTAEKVKKANFGIDLGFANTVYLKADYFTSRVNNMLISVKDAPLYQGYTEAYLPKLNEGKMKNSGYELTLGFNKQFNKDFSAFAEFNFMNTRNKLISTRETSRDPAAYPYLYREDGYAYGQLWGYMVDDSNGNGYFNSAEEITNSGLTYNVGVGGETPRVGDLKYVDMNNDGVIDDKDKVPMGYSNKFPEQEFSLAGGVNYGPWEFSLLLQGVARRSYFLEGMGVYENTGSGVVFSDLHLNAWTPERYAAGEEISFPALTMNTSTNQVNNSFFLQDASYLRVKNVEVAYNLPKKIAKLISAGNIRVGLNIQNLLTWDKMKSDEIDPEIGKLTSIQPYRVYNLSLNINF
jgi:TonB-linked SusC/RagA family outer membrane protein